MRHFQLPLAVAAVGILAGAWAAAGDPASAQSRDRRECFSARSVDSFRTSNDEYVDVRVGAGRYYRLELDGFCPDVDWSQRIALRARGSSWICRGLDAELIVPTPIGPQRCHVRAVHPLTREEYAASGRRRR